MKKILCLSLCFCIVFGLMNFYVSAESSLPIGVDETYLDRRSDCIEINGTKLYSVVVNQLGYACSAQKTAKMVESASVSMSNSLVSLKTVFVYNVDLKEVVGSFQSEKRKLYSKTVKGGGNIFVSSIDFSTITQSGTYRIYTPIGYSCDFEICDSPYNECTQATVDALYYQRCGSDLDTNIAGVFAHTACHTLSSNSALSGKEVQICDTYNSDTQQFVQNKNSYGEVLTYPASDFSGGLHDASDFGRYTLPGAQTVADLLISYKLFKSAFTTDKIIDNDGENIPDILDEARYEAKWLIKMQAENGGVYSKICTDTFAVDRAENDRYFINNGFKIQHISFASTAAVSGALALCYDVFKDIDESFANQCLVSSKKAFIYYTENINNTDDENAARKGSVASFGSIVGGGDYGGPEYNQCGWFMSNALYMVTGEKAYSDYINTQIASSKAYYTTVNSVNLGGYGTYCYLLMAKDNEFAIDKTIYDKCKEILTTAANSALENVYSDAFNNVIYSGVYGWGSNLQICDAVRPCAFLYAVYGEDYSFALRSSVNFFMGVNYNGYTMISGYGSKCPNNIYHSISKFGKSENGGKCIAGFVPGGFTTYDSPDLYYNDDPNNYVCNEITIYWNSSMSFILASVDAMNLSLVCEHNYEFVSTKHPNCTSGGYDIFKCSKCGGIDYKNNTLPFGHSYVAKIVKPTCTANGYTSYTCTMCGDTYKDSETKALGHSYSWVTTKKATYFATGSKAYKCSKCGKTYKTSTLSKLKLKTPSIKLSTKSRKITVKYAKVSGAKKYQVYIKIGNKWYKYTTSKTYYTKSKLKKGTRYYVKVRALTTYGSKTAYSSYSKTKYIKAK